MTRPPPAISLLRAHARPEQGTTLVSDPTAWITPKPAEARPAIRSARGDRPSEPSSPWGDATITGLVAAARMETPRSPGEMKDQSRQALYPQAQARMPSREKSD
ncbi:MAG TPA: hypothetical protein VKB77_05845 [Terriglobales bacterium]|nr:hypothetical protein [Terriglobales bacterium]